MRDELPSEGLGVVHSSEFYLLGAYTSDQVALLQRTTRPFPTLLCLQADNDRIISVLACCAVDGLIVDMRAAPPNNDAAFEAAMSKLRLAVGRAFARVVVLVATASGAMQVTRLHRAEGVSYLMTREPRQAWRFAAGLR